MGDIDEATMRAIREAQGGSGRRRAAVNYAQEKVIDAAPEAPRRRRLTKGADKKKPKKAARRVDSDDFLDDESEDDDDSDGGYGGPRKRRAAPPKRRAAKPKRRRRGSDSDESDDDDDDDDDESDDGWSDDSGRGAKGRPSKKVVRRPGRSGAVGKYSEPGSGDEDWSSGSDGGGGAVAAPAPEKVQSRIEKLLAQREVGGGGADGDGDGDGDGGMGGALEYLVKLRGKSHMHCVWLSEQEVLAEPQGGARITRWQRARQAGTVGQADVEPFPPEYTQVDKLVAERPSCRAAADGRHTFNLTQIARRPAAAAAAARSANPPATIVPDRTPMPIGPASDATSKRYWLIRLRLMTATSHILFSRNRWMLPSRTHTLRHCAPGARSGRGL